MATASDIHWLAGVYEGEGYCIFGCGTHRITLAQKDEWLGKELQRRFGGVVYDTPDKRTGVVYHVWRVTGARARGIMMSMYPLLSPRRQQQVLNVLRAAPGKRWRGVRSDAGME
jgi:hypothetical protein